VIFLKRYNLYIFLILIQIFLLSVSDTSYAIEINENTLNYNSIKKEKSTEEPSVLLEADTLTYNDTNNTIIANGSALLYYKSYTIQADKIIYNEMLDSVVASGNIILTDKNKSELYAEDLELADGLKNGFIYTAKLLLENNAKIISSKGQRIDGSITKFDDASFTLCNECTDGTNKPLTWELKADRIIHNEIDKIIEYNNVEFILVGKSLIKIPYLSHPDMTVQRKTGFLLPTYSISSFYGNAIKLPYFYSINKSSDIIFTPIITTKQGPLFNFEYRNKISENSYVNVSPSFIYQADPSDIAPGNIRFRNSLKTTAQLDINNKWNWGWDATFTSDDTFMRRYDIEGSTKYKSEIFLTGLSNKNYLSAKMVEYTNLLNESELDQPTIAPLIDHDYTFAFKPLNGNLKLNSQFASLSRNAGDEQTRLSSNLSWENKYITNHGIFFEPYIGIKADNFRTYDESDNSYYSFSRIHPKFSIKTSWPLYSASAYGNHLIEPVARLTFSGDEKSNNKILNEDSNVMNFNTLNLFEIDRSYGFDKIEGGHKFAVGINYDLEDTFGGHTSAKLGKSFHIGGLNSFDGSDWAGTDDYHSDIVASLSYNLLDVVDLDYKTKMDSNTKEITTNEFNITFNNNDSLFADMNYIEYSPSSNVLSNTKKEELSGGISLALTKDWSFNSRGTYNMEDNSVLNSLFGISYEDECLEISLSYKEDFYVDRDIKKDKSIMFNFNLKSFPSSD
jgi:LPS-assembly protein